MKIAYGRNSLLIQTCLQRRMVSKQNINVGSMLIRLIAGIFLVMQSASILKDQKSYNWPFFQQQFPPANQFEQFVRTYRKQYSSPHEETFRRVIFSQNSARISSHNSNTHRTYSMSINRFTDLTSEEFSTLYASTYQSTQEVKQYAQLVSQQIRRSSRHCNCPSKSEQLEKAKQRVKSTFEGLKKQQLRLIRQPINEDQQSGNKVHEFQSSLWPQSRLLQQLENPQKIPDSDWSSFAGNVKFQGMCGACYTFATADTLATLNAIYTFGFFVSLSTQQVLDCASNGLTYGCSGGFIEGAYAYIQGEGITTDYRYPYTSQISGVSGKCKNGGEFTISSFRNIPEGDCTAIRRELEFGPLAIGIAGYRLQFYESGVFKDCNNFIDHAVVLVGHKQHKGWKIKNSWGADWGEKGFAWIADGNNCGICNMAVSAYI